MDEDAYKGPIFEGCVASIGGLDKSLASAASSSVVRALGGPSSAELFLSRLGWTGAADGLREGLLLEMLEMTRNEARGCADVSRLLACTTTICQLVGAGGAVREAALPAALALLINRFPKVRKYAAEQIYLKLLAFEAEDESLQIPALQLQRALELVAETAWDGPLDHVRHARSPLFGLLGLAEPKKLAGKAADAASRAAAVGTFGTDDSESYSTLLADAARGLGSGM
uniref:Tubulin-specific chaperone D n=1 Tax=Tetraselmis sp. GSL018 TaxID=582737 RepID=A0A061RN78_9CHLO